MVGCDLLDLRCLFVNEIVGSVMLTMVLGAIVYFIIASKMRWGFETTVAVAFPLLLIIALAVGSITPILAFGTLVAGFMLTWLMTKIIGNR